MREIVQTIKIRAKKANAQTAHLFFPKRISQSLTKQRSCFFASALKYRIPINILKS
jgi:hypothetical protein